MNTDIIEKYHMLPRGGRVLCAVSGGADSMCLLHYLWSNREALGIEVCAAHFDHQLRGLESARDRTFVKDWCRTNGIELEIGFGKVREYAAENGMGLEEAARKLRYEFLETAAEKLGCGRIATAHNADDNAETVLFNLARGAGGAGLCGIPPVRGNIVRPLLGVTKREILDYLSQRGIDHVEDSTNKSDDYSRNLIRHRVMPVLKEINPEFSASVLRTSDILRADEEYLNAQARRFIDDNFAGGSLPADAMAALPEPVAARVVRLMSGRAVSKERADAVLALLGSGEAALAELPGMRVLVERGRVTFGAAQPLQSADMLIIPGETQPFGDTGFVIRSEIIENCKEINSSFNTFRFKYASICDNIFCTCRRDGDKIRLAGRGCTKSLKDLYNEGKLTLARRAENPVLRDGEGPTAVYGFGISQRCVPARGDRVLRIIIEETGDTKNVG
jgi:tRNA(Ile)-lysidine synthase